MKLTDLANSAEMVQLPLFDVTCTSQVEITTTSDLHRANSAVCVHLQLSSSGTEMNVKRELKESSIWPPVLRQSRKWLFECLQNLMPFVAFSDRQRREVCWVCVPMKFPCWQSDHVIFAAFTPEHDLPALSRHASLDFLNEEGKTVLGLAADLCLRDFEFIHLKDAYFLGYIIPLLHSAKQNEQIISTLLLEGFFSWLKDFCRGDLFLRH